jgi:hypothetical protein
MIIELKITNLNDWAIIQPLLKRLKISFVQKDMEQNLIAEEPATLYATNEIVGELKTRRAGFSKARFVMSDDFNAPLEDFKEYIL